MVQMLQYVTETTKILMRGFCVVSEKKAQTADLLELWLIFTQDLWRSVRVNKRFLDGRVNGWSTVLRGLQEAVQPLFGLIKPLSCWVTFQVMTCSVCSQLRWFRRSQRGLLLLVLREGTSRWGKPVDLDVWDMGVFWLGSVNKLWTSLNSSCCKHKTKIYLEKIGLKQTKWALIIIQYTLVISDEILYFTVSLDDFCPHSNIFSWNPFIKLRRVKVIHVIIYYIYENS